MTTFEWDGLKVPTQTKTDTVGATDETFYPSIVEFATTAFGMKIKITNNTGMTLYFKVVKNPYGGTPARYTVTPQNLGSVANGNTVEFNYTGLQVSQSNAPVAGDIPSGSTLDETVNLRVSAYLDAGYSDIYAYQNFDVPFKWIDESNVGWTTVDEDDFDDGTLQGWAGDNAIVSSSCYRSAPYSFETNVYVYGTWINQYKSFSIGDVARAFAVLYFRTKSTAGCETEIRIGGVLKHKFIVPTQETWFKIVVPMPLNETNQLKLSTQWLGTGPNGYVWLDNVKVIQS